MASFEGAAVEQSLKDLATPPPDLFAAAPFAVNTSAPPLPRGAAGRKKTVTLPWWAPYLYGLALLLVGVAAFFVGAWWATVTPST